MKLRRLTHLPHPHPVCSFLFLIPLAVDPHLGTIWVFSFSPRPASYFHTHAAFTTVGKKKTLPLLLFASHYFLRYLTLHGSVGSPSLVRATLPVFCHDEPRHACTL